MVVLGPTGGADAAGARRREYVAKIAAVAGVGAALLLNAVM